MKFSIFLFDRSILILCPYVHTFFCVVKFCLHLYIYSFTYFYILTLLKSYNIWAFFFAPFFIYRASLWFYDYSDIILHFHNNVSTNSVLPSFIRLYMIAHIHTMYKKNVFCLVYYISSIIFFRFSYERIPFDFFYVLILRFPRIKCGKRERIIDR